MLKLDSITAKNTEGKVVVAMKKRHDFQDKCRVVKIPKQNWEELVQEIKDKPRISGLLFDWESQNEF